MWVECAKTTPRENDISPLRFHSCGCAFPCAVLRGRDVALRNVRLASARVPASMMLEFCLPVPVPVAIVRVAQGRFPVGILAFPLSISAQFPCNFNGGKGGILPNDGIRMDVLAFILQNSAFFRIPFCGISRRSVGSSYTPRRRFARMVQIPFSHPSHKNHQSALTFS